MTVTCRMQRACNFEMMHVLQLQELAGCAEGCTVLCAHAVACVDSVALLTQDACIVLVEGSSGHISHKLKLQCCSRPTCLDSAGAIVVCGHQDGSVRCAL